MIKFLTDKIQSDKNQSRKSRSGHFEKVDPDRGCLTKALSGDEFFQITRDHSYVQELVDRGELTPEAAKHHPKKNFITRAMGTEDIVKVDTAVKGYGGGTLLVCSDGLTNFVEDEEIFNEINNNEDLDKSLHKLVDLANDRGGRDNITIVAMRREQN